MFSLAEDTDFNQLFPPIYHIYFIRKTNNGGCKQKNQTELIINYMVITSNRNTNSC